MESFKQEWEAQFKVFQAVAEKESIPEKKILTYIKETLDYYEKVVIEHRIPVKALIETRNMYRSFVNQINHGGIKFYVDCIKKGQSSGHFKNNIEIEKVAYSMSLIKFSIQYDQLSIFIHSYPTEEDWVSIREQILFATQLILNGIKK